MKWGVAAAALWCGAAQGQQAYRIALRMGTDEVLIVGGSFLFPGPDMRVLNTMARADGHADLEPGDEIYKVGPDYLARVKIEPRTDWKPGDRWTVYTGSGAPVGVTIQDLSFGLVCGGPDAYATALARFDSAGSADRIAGLREGAYLAAPGTGPEKVSMQPLVPVDPLQESAVAERAERLMRSRAEVESARFSARDLKYEGKLLRWRLPGETPLIFAESLWLDRAGKAVFGASAVVEDSRTGKILHFDTKAAEMIQQPEMAGERPEVGVFLNAWAVGTRRFVLRYTRGYEGFSVELVELVPDKGLVPTAVTFGYGC